MFWTKTGRDRTPSSSTSNRYCESIAERGLFGLCCYQFSLAFKPPRELPLPA
ncbi:hypothetical protein SynPROS91_01464 [Synechococcus sp. PROS-9-1]|nr:hypothetical protein SynPROS91_01464 [Synechococcus sp. PROS-9-1]